MKNISQLTILPLEELLRNQIYSALQGETIEKIMRIAKVRKNENYWRYILEGHSFKVDTNISPKLFQIFQQVKEKLGFEENVDFYISSDADVNAFALSSFEDDQPHIINVNSSLINLMTDDELRFILGHEIGHLLNKNAHLMKLIQFVFPNLDNLPTILYHKIRLWNQLSELSADRYGFIACPDAETCISAFFKMSSGIDTQKVQLNVQKFLVENEKRLDFFRNDTGLNLASHPINPVRVKAIDLFSRSVHFNNSSSALSDKELEKEMENLIQILLKIKNSELDILICYFIATAGLICAGIDKDIDEKEVEWLLEYLSDFTIFPRTFLDTVYKSGKVVEIFQDVTEKILEINPSERYNMLSFIINMILSDKAINEKELEFVFDLGINSFKLSSKEIAQIFADIVQEKYIPAIKDLS